MKSIVSQTLLPSQVIVVDDASHDRTLRTLHELQCRYAESLCIEVVSLEKNIGAGPARNIGWDRASQPYIAFLDADDAWHTNKLEIQYRWMKRNSAIALCGHKIKWVNNNYHPTAITDSWKVSEVTRFALLLSNPFPMSSVMVRRTIPVRFEDVYSADQLLWFRIVLAQYRASMLHVSLSYMYKAPYGQGGLSADLWQLEKAELENYRRIRKDNLISAALYSALVPYSLTKHIRRVMITSWHDYIGAYGV